MIEEVWIGCEDCPLYREKELGVQGEVCAVIPGKGVRQVYGGYERGSLKGRAQKILIRVLPGCPLLEGDVVIMRAWPDGMQS